MSVINLDKLHPQALGLKLNKINKKGVLVSCELVTFERGFDAVNTTLRRAGIAGAVIVEPLPDDMKADDFDYFADVYVSQDSWEQMVYLDKGSYSVLKNKWMPCRLEKDR